MADKQVIVEVTYDTTEAQKNVESLTKDIVQLENANKDLKKQLKDGEISQEDYSKAVESNRQTLAKNKAERRDNIKFLQAEEKSQDRLQKQVKLLTNERKKLNLEDEEGQKRAKQLNDQIDQLRETITDNSSALEKNKANIGNYSESIKEAFADTDLFNGGLKESIGGLLESATAGKNAGAGFGQVAGGIGQATKAALKFIATPIGAIIAAIVVALQLLIAALKRNEGVTNKFAEVWAGISNIIEEVIGRVQRLVDISIRLFKGQIDLNQAIDEGKHAFDGLGESIKDAYDEGVQLAQLQKQIEENAIASTVAVAELNKVYEEQSAIADDNTRSFAEREEANKKAAEAAKEAAQIEADAAALVTQEVNKRVEIAERQGRLNRELRQEQADAIAGQIEAETNLTRVIFENEKVRRELRQDRLERDLDILIDGFDNQKTINERIIANERETFQARQDLLDETEQLGLDSFNRQIETIRKFTGVRFDENELLAESDAVVLNERIRLLGLSEIIEGRLLEIIRDRRTAIQDLTEAQRELNEQQTEFDLKVQEEADADLERELERIAEELDAELDAINQREEALDAEADRDRQRLEERQNLYNSVFTGLGNILGNFLGSQERSFAEFAKDITIFLLDVIQKEVIAAQIRITAQSLAQPDSIATFGASGLIRAAAINGLITAAFTGAKAVIQRLDEGGEVKFGTFGGKFHSQGGNNLYDGAGNLVANVEKDENFYVLKRDASAHINALSRINESFGGRSFGNNVKHAQQGGQIDQTSTGGGLSPQDVQEIIRQTPIQVQVTDIQSGLIGNAMANDVGVVG